MNLRVAISLALALLAGLVAAGNISGVVMAIRRKKAGSDRGFSCVPLLSVLFAGVSWLIGRSTLGYWVLLPALVDPGTWTTLLGLMFIAREAWQERSKRE